MDSSFNPNRAHMPNVFFEALIFWKCNARLCKQLAIVLRNWQRDMHSGVLCNRWCLGNNFFFSISIQSNPIYLWHKENNKYTNRYINIKFQKGTKAGTALL